MPLFLDASGSERLKRVAALLDGAQNAPRETVSAPETGDVHRAVQITGPAVDGRYPAILQYRSEEDADWHYFLPAIECWAITPNGEALEEFSRYEGRCVSLHSDGKAVFNCIPSGAVGAFSGAKMKKTGAGQTISFATETTIDFNTTEWDTDSYVDLTNNLFTVPADGKYLVVASMPCALGAQTYFRIIFLINGTTTIEEGSTVTGFGTATSLYCSLSSILVLVEGDTVELRGYYAGDIIPASTFLGHGAFAITRQG